MSPRTRALSVVLMLAAGIAGLGLWWGPSRRTYASPPRAVRAAHGAEVLQAWRAAGVSGRAAVIFGRRLNGPPDPQGGAALGYVEEALARGPLRVVHHYVPDAAWPEVSATLTARRVPRPVEGGFAIPQGGGRIHVRPLSRFRPHQEPSLVVVAPGDWTPEEAARVASLLGRGLVSADVLTVLGGDEAAYRTLAPLAGGGRP